MGTTGHCSGRGLQLRERLAMPELKETGQVIYDVVEQWPQPQKIRGLFLLNLRKLCTMTWFSFYLKKKKGRKNKTKEWFFEQ